jgi:RND family efflux transporter MFP subunit
VLGALLVLGLFAILLIVGLVPRMELQPQLAAAAQQEQTAKPIVTVVNPTVPPLSEKTTLPGTIEPLEEATISARSSGYLKQWFVDIGDHVKAGQLMAIVETPDTDALTAQARAELASSGATLQQSKATVQNSVANVENSQASLDKAVAAVQQAQAQVDQARAAYEQGIAEVKQNQANVLQQQAALTLADATEKRYAYLLQEGAVARETYEQELEALKAGQATVAAAQSAVTASVANVASLKEAVASAVANVKANVDAVNAARATVMASKYTVDANNAGVNAAAENVNSNAANYQHNAVLSAFQRIYAPFDGIITARNVDVGSLVTTAGAPTAAIVGPEATAATGGLYSMERTDRLSIYVSIPQNFVGALSPGDHAAVTVSELGARPFDGLVVRNASALDPTTRTLLTEIQVPNPQGLLRPGLFASVTFKVKRTLSAWRIPDSALIVDSDGTRVAIVTPDNKIHFQKVTVGTDYGKSMDISEGIAGNVTLVANPNAGLLEGEAVEPVKAPAMGGPGGVGAAAGSGNGAATGGANAPGSGPQGQTGAAPAAGATGGGQQAPQPSAS